MKYASTMHNPGDAISPPERPAGATWNWTLLSTHAVNDSVVGRVRVIAIWVHS